MITAILNCYRRPEYLEEQIDALKRQTVPPKEIWVWVNRNQDILNEDFDNKLDLLSDQGIKIFDCNFNWKYCGRFSSACLVDTEYTAIFDDDTMPGSEWFENCLSNIKKQEGIYGGVGVRLNSSYSYRHHDRYGWPSANEDVLEVDLVGHAWFFPAHYIKYMWMEKPLWANGEDMHFSAMCQIHGGIKTYVPPHPLDYKEVWSSLKGYEYGVGEVASSTVNNHKQFYQERDNCLNRLINLGWQLKKNSVWIGKG